MCALRRQRLGRKGFDRGLYKLAHLGPLLLGKALLNVEQFSFAGTKGCHQLWVELASGLSAGQSIASAGGTGFRPGGLAPAVIATVIAAVIKASDV